MEINRTQSLFQSLENIKLTTMFQPSSMLRYRPYFNSDSTLKWRTIFNVEASTLDQRWNMVARRRDQYSTIIIQRWYNIVWRIQKLQEEHR